MRSNGFCLANTETIVFDDSPPEEKDRPSSTDSAEHLWVWWSFAAKQQKKMWFFFTTTFLLTFKVHTALKCEGHVGPPTHTGTLSEHLFLPWVCVCVSEAQEELILLATKQDSFSFFPPLLGKKPLPLNSAARFSQPNQLTVIPPCPQSNASFNFVARYEDGAEFLPVEADVCDGDAEAYVTNLSYYHLVPFETDILEWGTDPRGH